MMIIETYLIKSLLKTHDLRDNFVTISIAAANHFFGYFSIIESVWEYHSTF